MKKTTPADFKNALAAAGARPGDVVLLHSHLPAFGLAEGGPEALIAAALDFLGPAGTLVMPAFTLSYPRTRKFDSAKTPSEMGALTEAFRLRPGTLRSPHPIHSLCVSGARARELAGAWAPSSFGPGSPFEKLHEADALLVCAGVGAERLTFVHFVEETVGVPYRGLKPYPGEVVIDGKPDPRPYAMYSRDLRFKLDLPGFHRTLHREGLETTVPLAYGTLYSYRAKELFTRVSALLRKNPGLLLSPDSPLPDLIAGRIQCQP